MPETQQEKITNIIIEKLGADKNKVTPDADFINDLGADSLDQVELIMELEEAFNLEISDEDAESLINLTKVLEYLKEHKK